MGGKALNKYGIITKRIDSAEYFKIMSEIQTRIFTDLNIHSTHVLSYHTKKSHGDLDLLVKNTKDVEWRKYINNAFKPQAIHYNGGVS
jgi:hypothetical protein